MSKPLLSAVEFKLAQSSPAPSHKRDFLWVSCIKLCCSTNEASWALFDSYKTKLWSIKCKWIGTSICVWKQSSYTELSRVINASAASPQHSWRLDVSVCLVSRWSIRSSKDQVETQKLWSGLMITATRGPSTVRRPTAACLLSSGLGSWVTGVGCSSWRFLGDFYIHITQMKGRNASLCHVQASEAWQRPRVGLGVVQRCCGLEGNFYPWLDAVSWQQN